MTVARGYASLSHAIASPPLGGPPALNPVRDCQSVSFLGRWLKSIACLYVLN